MSTRRMLQCPLGAWTRCAPWRAAVRNQLWRRSSSTGLFCEHLPPLCREGCCDVRLLRGHFAGLELDVAEPNASDSPVKSGQAVLDGIPPQQFDTLLVLVLALAVRMLLPVVACALLGCHPGGVVVVGPHVLEELVLHQVDGLVLDLVRGLSKISRTSQ